MNLIDARKSFFYLILLFIGNLYFIREGLAQEFHVPVLVAPVQDEAGLFSPEVVVRLSRLLSDLRAQGGPQLQVLTLSSLGGLPIDQASIKIVESWQLGDRAKDDGILLLVSKTERKIRIEVGQGLEGELPDVVAKRIITRVINPLFKAGQMDRGLSEGVLAILGYVAPQFLEANHLGGETVAESDDRSPLSTLLIFGLFLLIMILRMMFGGPRTYGTGYRHGGGGGIWPGGGGSSSGGWSGGGGGFSGGGASGDW